MYSSGPALPFSFLPARSPKVTFQRTVGQVADGVSGSMTLDHGCSSSDQYGSNHCALHWGQSYKANITANLSKTLTTKSKISWDIESPLLKLRGSCAACGKDCSIKIPIIGQLVPIPMPPCPLKAQTLTELEPFTLPPLDPVALGVKFTGTVTGTDDGGSTLFVIDVDGNIKWG